MTQGPRLVHANEGVQGVGEHALHPLHHLRELRERIPERRKRAEGFEHFGDAGGFVADAFEIGDGFDDGHHQAQVARRGLAPGNDVSAGVVDADLKAIHGLVEGGHGLRGIRIPGAEAEAHGLQLALHEPAHLRHHGPQLVKLGVVLS